MLTVVGHKFGAPKGIASLFVKRALKLPPMIRGGSQEAGRRAGTENVMLIVGMGKAAEVQALLPLLSLTMLVPMRKWTGWSVGIDPYPLYSESLTMGQLHLEV